MRCDQPMGLCPKAYEFLKENAHKIRVTVIKEFFPMNPDTGTFIGREESVSYQPYFVKCGEYKGDYQDEPYPLYRYYLAATSEGYAKYGAYVEEFLLGVVYFSGPMMYLGLKSQYGNPVSALNWTHQEMDSNGRSDFDPPPFDPPDSILD